MACNFKWISDEQAKALFENLRRRGARTAAQAEKMLLDSGLEPNKARAFALGRFGDAAAAVSANTVANRPGGAPIKGSAEARVVDIVKGAKRMTAEQKTAMRKARLAAVDPKVDAILEKRRTAPDSLTPQERAVVAKADEATGASMKEATRRPFEPIAQKVSSADQQALIDGAKNAAHLTREEQLISDTALKGVFNSTVMVPPTDAQLLVLNKVYPALAESLYGKRPAFNRFVDIGLPWSNLSRALTAGGDFSMALRQMFFYTGTKEWRGAVGKMLTQFKTHEQEVAHYESKLRSKYAQDFRDLQQVGLGLLDAPPQKEGTFLERRLRDNIEGHSSVPERIPGAGHIYKFGNRAARVGLNEIRTSLYENIMDSAKTSGIDVENPEIKQAVARDILRKTGKGNLGPLEAHKKFIGLGIFSPSLIASRFQALNPFLYSNLPNALRARMISKAAIGLGVNAAFATAGVLVLGSKIGTDPTDSDFLKEIHPSMPNTRFDMAGGYGQYMRLIASVIKRHTTDEKGVVHMLGKEHGPNSQTLADLAARMLRSKAAPPLAMAWDLASGETFTGDKTSFRTMANYFYPMHVGDTVDAVKDAGPAAALVVGPLATLGMGVSTYTRGGAKAALFEQVHTQGWDKAKPLADAAFKNGLLSQSQYQDLERGAKTTASRATLMDVRDLGDLKATVDSMPKADEQWRANLVELRTLQPQLRDAEFRRKQGISTSFEDAKAQGIRRRIAELTRKMSLPPPK